MNSDTVQPLRAINLLDESLAYAKVAGLRELGVATVERAFSEKTGVPMDTGEQSPLYIEERLKARVIGQDEAVRVVAETMRRSRHGAAQPEQAV